MIKIIVIHDCINDRKQICCTFYGEKVCWHFLNDELHLPSLFAENLLRPCVAIAYSIFGYFLMCCCSPVLDFSQELALRNLDQENGLTW
jgi:hypothetical protein